jgi:prephenate dehydratase
MKIGVMGGKGSFSEQAGLRYVTEQELGESDVIPLISAENVLTALEKGDIDRAIFPIENSNGGIVLEAVHAMANHRFTIERMFELDVHHMLLVKPGIDATVVTSISSHDQAIKQCRMYLRRTWPNAEIVPYKDTAQAAADLAAGILPPTTAIIAPRGCATLYGLEVLEESIQDLKFNYTVFVVASQFPKSGE